MKKALLITMILLSFGSLKAQTADYFISNGNLMLKKGGTTTTFENGYSSNPIVDFAEGELNGKYYLIFWRLKGDVKLCSIREDGKWSDQTDFSCGCGKNVDKIKFVDKQTLIITCSNGKRFKKTMSQYGGSSESGI
jgi:hypothetical protein